MSIDQVNTQVDNGDYKKIIDDLSNRVYRSQDRISEIYANMEYPYNLLVPKDYFGDDRNLIKFINGEYKYIDILDEYDKEWQELKNCLNNLNSFYEAGYHTDFNPKKKLIHQIDEYEFCIEEFINSVFDSLEHFILKGKQIIDVLNVFVEIYNKLASIEIDKKYIYLYKQRLQKFVDFYDLDMPQDVALHNTKATLKSCSFNKSLDDMDGQEFEKYCIELLKTNGYGNIQLTKVTGDQGVDIIAYKDDIKYAFQCKCYSQGVGNSAIQEVVSGKVFYDCDVAVVITNRYFTDSAIELAKANKVKLWDRNKILEMLNNMSK